MKTKRKILIISTLTFSTSILSCVSSPSCETKNIAKNSNIKYKELEERLILNGSELFDNDKLAQKYNEIKKSNVEIIKEINRKLSATFKMLYLKEMYISINSTIFIDWNKLDEILNYYEKFKYQAWYKEILIYIIRGLRSNNLSDTKLDWKQIDLRNKSDQEKLEYFILDNFFYLESQSQKFVFKVLFNNYINYVLELIKSIDTNEVRDSYIYKQSFSDVLKSIILPSAYLINPELIDDSSYFSRLKNTNMWDLLKNKTKYSNSIIDLFDFDDNNYPRIEEVIELPKIQDNCEAKKTKEIKNDNKSEQLNHIIWDWNWAFFDSTPKATIEEWKLAKEELNKKYNEDLIGPIGLKEFNNNNLISIELGLNSDQLANFSYSYFSNDDKNETEVIINRDKLVIIDFAQYKEKYENLIKIAICYLFNINALNNLEKEYNEQDNHETSLTWELMKKNKYSALLWNELSELIPKKVKKEILIPITLNENLYTNKKINNRSLRVKVFDWLCWTTLPLKYIEENTTPKLRIKKLLYSDESKALDAKKQDQAN
ncbi:hypothetical protein [Mycoplasma sp. VS31B]